MAEFIRFACDQCEGQLKCLPRQAGSRLRCPNCAAVVRAPRLDGETQWLTRRSKINGEGPASPFWVGLPVTFPLCGYHVALEIESNSKIVFRVSPDQTADQMESDDGYCVDATQAEVAEFLHFYLTTPGGRAMLSFPSGLPATRHRFFALNEILADWRVLSRPLNKRGQLQQTIECIALVKDQRHGPGRCARNTRNANGLCPKHDVPNIATIWSHDSPEHYDLAAP